MKRPDNCFRDYVSRLNQEQLKYLAVRLSNRIGSDMAEALNLMANNQDLDRILSAARSADELYDWADQIQALVERELNRRSPELQEAR